MSLLAAAPLTQCELLYGPQSPHAACSDPPSQPLLPYGLGRLQQFVCAAPLGQPLLLFGPRPACAALRARCVAHAAATRAPCPPSRGPRGWWPEEAAGRRTVPAALKLLLPFCHYLAGSWWQCDGGSGAAQCTGPATATATAAFSASSISAQQSLRSLQHRWGCRPYVPGFVLCHCVCRTRLHHCPLSCGVVRVACGVRELVFRRSYQPSWPGGVAVQLAGFKRILGVLGAVAVCLRNKTMFLS